MRSRIVRTLVAVPLVIAVAVAGIFLGLRVAGPQTYETALGHVEISVKPRLDGQINLFIPLAAWGVTVDAFDSPIEVRAEPQSINRDAVIKAAAGDGDLLARAETNVRAAVNAALLRALAAASLGALVLGLALALTLAAAGRRTRGVLVAAMLVPAVCAAGIGGLTIWRAGSTFDAGSIRQAEFYANGAELGQLLKAAENARQTGADYSSSVRDAIGGFAGVLAAGGNLTGTGKTNSLILASDLHGNLPVLGALRGILDDEPLFLAGDFGHSGSEAEARIIAPRVADLGRRVVAVSGNHDSTTMMRVLARAGVDVLTRKGRLTADGGIQGPPVQSISGLNVAGFDDPLEDRGPNPGRPERVFSFSELPDGDRRFEQAERNLIDWFRSLRPRPDLVLVHQNGLAQALARAVSPESSAPLTILTGHDHRQHIDIYPGATVVDAGTLGAGGIVQGASGVIGLANLHFGSPDARLVVADLMELDAQTGSARAQRTPIDDPAICELEEVNCRP